MINAGYGNEKPIGKIIFKPVSIKYVVQNEKLLCKFSFI